MTIFRNSPILVTCLYILSYLKNFKFYLLFVCVDVCMYICVCAHMHVCVHICVCVYAHVWRSEDNFQVSPLSFYRVGPWN